MKEGIMKKSELKSVIKELIQEMWVGWEESKEDDVCKKCDGTGKHPAEKGMGCQYCGGSGKSVHQPIKKLSPWKPGPKFEAADDIEIPGGPGGEEGGEETGLKTTGRITEPGSDAALVDLYKGSKGKADTLPSVGGAMSENTKADLQSLLREAVSEVIREVEFQDEPDRDWEEQQELIAMKRIQSYSHWLIGHISGVQPNELQKILGNIKQEIDALVDAHEKRGRKKQQTPLKNTLLYKHGRPVPGMKEGHKEQPVTINIIDKVKEKIKVDEKAPSGWEGTVKAMKKHPEIDNPWALSNYMKNKGDKSHKK
jgi:hypothetical protein